MNLIDSMPKPDFDSRLVWCKTRLLEWREGSLSRENAYFVWALLVGWGQATPLAYEGGEYIRLANFFEIELRYNVS